jgi:hypothetical protein
MRSGIVLLCMLICTSYQLALAAMHIIYVAWQGPQQFQPYRISTTVNADGQKTQVKSVGQSKVM